MMRGIPATRVTAYTYEADYHCVDDTRKRFGKDEYGNSYGVDNEGNEIGAVFSDQAEPGLYFEACDDCHRVICLTCGETTDLNEWLDQNGERYNTCWNCGTHEEES